jgi:hypothetical protein
VQYSFSQVLYLLFFFLIGVVSAGQGDVVSHIRITHATPEAGETQRRRTSHEDIFHSKLTESRLRISQDATPKTEKQEVVVAQVEDGLRLRIAGTNCNESLLFRAQDESYSPMMCLQTSVCKGAIDDVDDGLGVSQSFDSTKRVSPHHLYGSNMDRVESENICSYHENGEVVPVHIVVSDSEENIMGALHGNKSPDVRSGSGLRGELERHLKMTSSQADYDRSLEGATNDFNTHNHVEGMGGGGKCIRPLAQSSPEPTQMKLQVSSDPVPPLSLGRLPSDRMDDRDRRDMNEQNDERFDSTEQVSTFGETMSEHCQSSQSLSQPHVSISQNSFVRPSSQGSSSRREIAISHKTRTPRDCLEEQKHKIREDRETLLADLRDVEKGEKLARDSRETVTRKAAVDTKISSSTRTRKGAETGVERDRHTNSGSFHETSECHSKVRDLESRSSKPNTPPSSLSGVHSRKPGQERSRSAPGKKVTLAENKLELFHVEGPSGILPAELREVEARIESCKNTPRFDASSPRRPDVNDNGIGKKVRQENAAGPNIDDQAYLPPVVAYPVVDYEKYFPKFRSVITSYFTSVHVQHHAQMSAASTMATKSTASQRTEKVRLNQQNIQITMSHGEELALKFQWKLYAVFQSVMKDYSAVFTNIRPSTSGGTYEQQQETQKGNKSVYGGGKGAFTAHYRVKASSRPEVYNIVSDVLERMNDWEELPQGLGLGNTWNLLWFVISPFSKNA